MPSSTVLQRSSFLEACALESMYRTTTHSYLLPLSKASQARLHRPVRIMGHGVASICEPNEIRLRQLLTVCPSLSQDVVSMIRLRIQVLPDIVNALVLTAAFSAGLSYLYCSSRCLLGLALEGKAPKIFTKTTRKGVPIYAVVFVLLISL